jgi:hypothetical protein
MQQQWLIAGRALCELGIRTLRDEVGDNPDLGREPVVIAAHTALVVALDALEAVASRPGPPALAEAHAACARAQEAVAQARAAIESVRTLRVAERST